MIKSFCLYMTIFLFSILNFEISNNFMRKKKCAASFIFVFFFFLSMLPPLILASLRTVGTDYYPYIDIYDDISQQTLVEYLSHGNSYVEIGYYLINRLSYLIFNSEYAVFAISSAIILGFIYMTLLRINSKYSWFGLYVFYMTLYSYSYNGIRFGISITIILYACTDLLKNKNFRFVLWVLLASLFHKISLICLLFLFIKRLSNIKMNYLRNMIYSVVVIASPFYLAILIKIFSNFGIFSRYFEVYNIDYNSGGWGFLQYILPILPLILLLRKTISVSDKNYELLFNIALLQIPFTYIGYFSAQASRISWYPEAIYMILIPRLLENITDKHNRQIVIIYYMVWYFVYYLVTYVYLRSSEVYPYLSIFNI